MERWHSRKHWALWFFQSIWLSACLNINIKAQSKWKCPNFSSCTLSNVQQELCVKPLHVLSGTDCIKLISVAFRHNLVQQWWLNTSLHPFGVHIYHHLRSSHLKLNCDNLLVRTWSKGPYQSLQAMTMYMYFFHETNFWFGNQYLQRMPVFHTPHLRMLQAKHLSSFSECNSSRV